LQDGAWFYQSDLVGAPTGLQMYDYPLTDNFTYLIIKLLVLLTGNYVVANNIFFLLTFVLTAIASAFVLRRLGVSGAVAIVFSVLYAFVPYHFLRGEAQILLAAYYVVPLVVLLALSMWSDAPESLFGDGRGDVASRVDWRRYAAILAICVIVGSSPLYYAFFGCLLIGVACLAQFIQTPRLRVLARGALVLGGIGGTVLLNMLPTFLYYARHGPNLQVARRSAPEAEVHGLKIGHLPLPIGQHRLELFRRLAAQYAAGQPPLQGENAAATLGLVGSLGFLGLLVALVVQRAHGALRVYYRLAVLNLACVLFATI